MVTTWPHNVPFSFSPWRDHDLILWKVDSPPKAFEDHFSQRLNEMQNGSRTKPILLRERAQILEGKVIAKLYMYFFSWTFEKINSGFSLIFFFSKETYMATSSNLFQMDLVIEWLIIHSVVSYVVKLRRACNKLVWSCFMVKWQKG